MLELEGTQKDGAPVVFLKYFNIPPFDIEAYVFTLYTIGAKSGTFWETVVPLVPSWRCH